MMAEAPIEVGIRNVRGGCLKPGEAKAGHLGRWVESRPRDSKGTLHPPKTVGARYERIRARDGAKLGLG